MAAMRATTVPLDDETSPGRAIPARVTRLRRWMFAGAAAVLTYATALLVVASLSADLGILVYQGGPVVLVDPSSAAAEAGIQRGDVIVAIDGRPVTDSMTRMAWLDAIDVGDVVEWTVRRGDTTHQVSFRVPRRVPIASAAGVALAAILLALAIFADRGRRHDLPQAFFRSSLVYVVFLAGAFGLDVAIREPLLFIPWLYAMALAAPVTCRFMIRFPNGRRWFSRAELALLYGPPLAVVTVMAVNDIAFRLGAPLPHAWMISEVGGGAAIGLSTLYLTLGAIARARRLRAKQHEIDPIAARWLH